MILVVGPPLSGVSSLAAAVRNRIPGHRVLENPGPGEFAALLIFVVSAAAPMTASDADLLRVAAGQAGAVVAAVSKIDVHRTWRQVLAANCAALPGQTWVGVAAAPEVGSPRVDDLVEAVRAGLASGRARDGLIAQDRPVAQDRPGELRKRVAERTITRRGLVQQARVQLAGQARAMGAGLRAELHQSAATVSARRAEAFRRDVHRRARRLVDDLDRVVTARLAEVAEGWGAREAVDPPPDPPPELVIPAARPPGLENRLTALLGGGFGVGAAVTLDRMLTPIGTPAAAAASVAVGLGLGAWVVHTRRVLSARASLDRWIDEVAVTLRTAMEERVAARVLAAEIELRAGGFL